MAAPMVFYTKVDGSLYTAPSQASETSLIVPHPRTLRKAREQVTAMVNSGVSPRRIRRYLHRWVLWWVSALQRWQHQELLEWFLDVCWDIVPAAYAAGLIQQAIKPAYHDLVPDLSAEGSPANA